MVTDRNADNGCMFCYNIGLFPHPFWGKEYVHMCLSACLSACKFVGIVCMFACDLEGGDIAHCSIFFIFFFNFFQISAVKT